MSEPPKQFSAQTFEQMLRETLAEYRQVIPYRSDLLFTEFLPRGYTMTTLSCVPDEHFHRVLFIKSVLGMFITLLDDFADNPELRNKELLNKLYRVPFDDEFIKPESCTETERKICDLALSLRSKMRSSIRFLPNFLSYYDVFKFDFEQVTRANQYSELMTDYPHIINPAECVQFGPYNMGMVLAGMIDLMSCPNRSNPLGILRQAFIIGQRHARLSNVITTMGRERSERDCTNEIIGLSRYYGSSIEQQCELAQGEMSQLIRELEQINTTQFDMRLYVRGLQDLHSLHSSLIGTI